MSTHLRFFGWDVPDSSSPLSSGSSSLERFPSELSEPGGELERGGDGAVEGEEDL